MVFKKKHTDTRTKSNLLNASDSKYLYYSKRRPNSSSVDKNKKGQDISRNRQPVEQKRKTKKMFLAGLILIFLFLVLFLVLFLGTLNPNVKVAISGGSAIHRNESVYKDEAVKFINQSFLNQTKVFFDSQGLTNNLKQNFPEITSVNISLPFFGRTPMANLKITKPGFILNSNNQTFLISNDGTALFKLSDVKSVSNLNLKTVTDRAAINIEPGKTALPKEQAQFINSVVEQLESQGYVVDTLIIPASIFDLHVKLKDQPYFIKLNILEDAKQQVGSFIALQKHLEEKGQRPNEYVDVRVGERVFYK